MSTFDGRIREYPAISIDRFVEKSYAKYYFLSHVHSDHLVGLENRNFNNRIYCTEQSAKLLPLIATRREKTLKYDHVKHLLIPIPYSTPTTINTPEYGPLTFTFLPANHCLGSALILIEGRKHKGTILYTGDIRAEKDFCERELGCLLRYRIQNLYMDTTCCREDRMKFISKPKSIELLLELIESHSNHYHFYIDCWTFGYEEMWAAVADTFNQKVHVSQQRYNMFCAADPSYTEYLTPDPKGTRFHSCDWDADCAIHEPNMISIHPQPTTNHRATEYVLSKHAKLVQTDLPYTCKPFKRMTLPFSFHSSCIEIAEFHKFVRPKTFSANVAHGKWETMNQIRELLVKLGCNLGDISSSSEFSSSASNGSHNKRRGLSLDNSTIRRSLSTTLSGSGSSGFSSSWGSMMAPISRARSRSFEGRRSSFKALTPLRERSENTTISKDSSSSSRSKSKTPLRQTTTHSQPLPRTVNSLISTPPHNVSKSPCHLNVSTKSTLSLNQISNASVAKQEKSLAKSKEVDPLGDCTNETYSSSVHNTIVSQHTMYKSPIHAQEHEQDGCIVLSSDEEDDEGHKPYYTNRSFIQRLKQVTVKREDRKAIFGVA